MEKSLQQPPLPTESQIPLYFVPTEHWHCCELPVQRQTMSFDNSALPEIQTQGAKISGLKEYSAPQVTLASIATDHYTHILFHQQAAHPCCCCALSPRLCLQLHTSLSCSQPTALPIKYRGLVSCFPPNTQFPPHQVPYKLSSKKPCSFRKPPASPYDASQRH